MRQNSESVNLASQIARAAIAVANRGVIAMIGVKPTMERIVESGNKISGIVDTINGNAFKTDILTHNFSVEAAPHLFYAAMAFSV